MGLGLLVCGGTEYWYQTRIYTALYTPFVLRHGHVVTPEFKINLSRYYVAWITTGDYLYAPEGPCPDGTSLRSELTLRKNGKPVVTMSREQAADFRASHDPTFQEFYADSGTYQLDFNFLGDPSCANSKYTRLTVEIFPWNTDDVQTTRGSIELIAVLLMVGGGIVLFRADARPFELRGSPAKLAALLGAGAAANRANPVPSASQQMHSGDGLLGWSPFQALRRRGWPGLGVGPWGRSSDLQFPIATRNPANAAPMMATACSSCMTLLVLATF